MPETNGYQVLEWMNEEYVIERIPVIVILAEDNHESIEKAYELGAMDYFTHPFDMFEIQKRVAGTLNLYKKYENLIMASMQVIYVIQIIVEYFMPVMVFAASLMLKETIFMEKILIVIQV